MNDILDKITNVLKKYLDIKKYDFFLYGSRAKWDFFFRSDYDIWILWKEKISNKTKFKIEEEFENIPALIDFTDFANVSKEFKENAMKNVIWLNKIKKDI